MHKLSIFCLITCFLAGIYFFKYRQDISSKTLLIGTNVWTGYEAFYVSKNNGLLKPENAKMVEYGSATQVMRSFRNQIIDVAALTLDEALLLVNEGHRLKVISITDISNGGDVLIAKPDFSKTSQLRGKKVGCEASALGHYMLRRALSFADMSIEDVTVIDVSVDQHAFGYNNNHFDAVITFDPVRANLIKKGANTLFDSSLIPGEILDVLVVQEDVFFQYKSEIRDLLKIWFESLTFIQNNPRKSSILMSKRLRMNIDEILASLSLIEQPNLKKCLDLMKKEDGIVKSIENLSKMMSDMGIIDLNNIDSSVILDTSLLEGIIQK